MITLRDKLYESLLDDEDDLVDDNTGLVYDWGKAIGLTDATNTNKVSINTFSIQPNGSVNANMYDLNISLLGNRNWRKGSELKLTDVLPIGIDFNYISQLSLGVDCTAYHCHDILSNDGFKHLSKFPINSLILKYKVYKLNHLDFNLLGNSEMDHLSLELFGGNDPDGVVDIYKYPKFPLKYMTIKSYGRPVVSNYIKGMNCEYLLMSGMVTSVNGVNKQVIIPKDLIAGIKIPKINNDPDCVKALDDLFRDNNIKQLVYESLYNLKSTRYLIEKTRSGYKLKKSPN